VSITSARTRRVRVTPQPATAAPGGDDAYAAWMARVDARIGRKCGLATADLPDADYRAWFDRGVSSVEAADHVLPF
jgi:hypothetical protein